MLLGSIGTWVRIPGPPKTLILFFFTYLHAASQVMSIIYLKHPSAMWLQAQIQGSWVNDHHTLSQHAPWRIRKVKSRLEQLGFKFPNVPPNWASTPLGLFSFFSLYFPFNYFTINYYYYYYLINQINFFS